MIKDDSTTSAIIIIFTTIDNAVISSIGIRYQEISRETSVLSKS